MSAKYIAALLPLLAPFATAEVATFTHYGSGDGYGSQNCANPPADRPLACGAGTNNVQGYSAAISQNYYGAGPGQGAGPGCGECWSLEITADQNGQPVTQKTITVTVNNLCPAAGNEQWCGMSGNGTNNYGGQVHFDICSDNGGSEAFFTSSGSGKGTATQIPCGGGSPNVPGSSSAGPSSSSSSTTSSASQGGAGGNSGAGGSPSTTTSTSTTNTPYHGGGGGKFGVKPHMSSSVRAGKMGGHRHSHTTPVPNSSNHNYRPNYGGPVGPGDHPGGEKAGVNGNQGVKAQGDQGGSTVTSTVTITNHITSTDTVTVTATASATNDQCSN